MSLLKEIRIKKFSIISLLIPLMATLFMGTACTDDPIGSSARGRNLEIYSDFPEIVDQAVFELDGKTRLFAPSASNREIVVVNTKITNRTTTVIPIVVDTESVMLGDRRGKKYPPINPYNVESVNSEEAVNASPILWGTFELARGYQIEGFLIFDVPKGLLLGTLFWDEVEYIPVDFVNYLEN